MKTTLSSQVRRTLNYIADQINDLPVSAPLPPVWEIRKALGVSQLSVQKACDLLENQGKIVRKPRKGIFVSDHTQNGDFAIVVLPELLGPTASPYYALACNALVERIHGHRPNCDVKMHFGKVASPNSLFQPPTDLTVPTVAAKLRGVFSFHPLHEIGDVAQSLKRSGIPTIMLKEMGSAEADYSVAFDKGGAIQKYMAALAQSGCRSVGVLGIVSFEKDGGFALHAPLVKAAREAGLEIRQEWMPVSTGVTVTTDKIGYEHFLQLWKQTEKPDGIVVLDDVACRGVLRGCLQFGVDLPGDIQLVTHANRHVELPYHKPITRVEFDTDEQAYHAVDLAIKFLRGQASPEKHILLSGKLIQGETTQT
jgi:hypothetical protein